MSRLERLLQELQTATELQTAMATQAAMAMRLQAASAMPAAELQQSLQELFAIGTEFVRICGRVCDRYE